MENQNNATDKLNVVVQYFDGCPHSDEMIENVKMAVSEYKNNIKYTEINIKNNREAAEHSFRGSPTLLINGIDIDDMKEPATPKMACRFYPNGIPTVQKIKEKFHDIQSGLR